MSGNTFYAFLGHNHVCNLGTALILIALILIVAWLRALQYFNQILELDDRKYEDYIKILESYRYLREYSAGLTFVKNHFHKINSFTYVIYFLSREKYEISKVDYQDFIVIEKNKIVNNIPGFLAKKKKKQKKESPIEHYLVEKYLALRTYEFALQVLRKEIHTIYKLASAIAMYAAEIENEKKINISKIKEVVKAKDKSNEYNSYIAYLIEISENYFGAKLHYTFSTVIDSI